MKKIVKALAVGLGAVAFVPFAVGACTTYAHADDVGSDVLTDTRYSAVGLAPVDILVGILADIADEVYPDTSVFERGTLNKFAENAAKLFANSFNGKSFGVAPNFTPITIEDSFIVMGKRKVMYPNGEYELDTCYVYINKNDTLATPQQFGSVTVAPNTVFMVRSCSWNGDTHGVSFPIQENNMYLWTYNTTTGFMQFELRSPANDTYVYDIASGRETVGYRHGGNEWTSGNPRMSFINNTVNTIVCNDLVNYYTNNGQASYSTYLPDYYFTDFEAFLGTGYNYDMSVGFMQSPMPWYITTAFFNTDDFDSNHIKTYYNTDSEDIDPSKPPAYVLPNDNPLAVGNEINNNTINNYADYGMTVIDGELHIDPDILAGALAPLINPDFNGLLGGVFDAQPQIGLGFDTPLDLNLPDIVSNWLQSLVPVDFARPLVPTITTLSEWDILPSYSTATFPADIMDGGEELALHTLDITDALGITSIFLLLALIGLLTYAIF